MPSSSDPRLLAYPASKPSKFQTALKWISSLFSKGGEAFAHGLMLSMFCTVGWVVISQTFIGQFFVPAIKKLLQSYLAMALRGIGWIISDTFVGEWLGPALKKLLVSYFTTILPSAMGPWIGWLLLGGAAAIIAGHFLFAALTGTLFDQFNAQRPYGTWLYIGVSWLAPAVKFALSCAQGAAIGPALLWTGIVGGCLGALTSTIVPILDSPYERNEALKKVITFIAETLVPPLLRAYQVVSGWICDVFGPTVNMILERFVPEEDITPPSPSPQRPLPPQRFEAQAAPAPAPALAEVAESPVAGLPAAPSPRPLSPGP